jgi:7,8-dihydropterin-6-yl-methyl-4-(beta-D-ribofuranosyl)aminobenzene 5'-phosphate synthase
VDNNTLIDRYFLGEPGFCLHIQTDGGRNILLDTGYSDAFLRNAQKMELDLKKIFMIVLSHGHLDHTWGLNHLAAFLTEAAIEGQKPLRPELLCHPNALDDRSIDNEPQIGSLLSPAKASSLFTYKPSADPIWIEKNLVYLGEIKRRFNFEQSPPLGIRQSQGKNESDTIPDDTALAYISDKGLVILTGCSHAGICNITAQAREITGVSRVRDIIGGLHLQNASQERLEATAHHLQQLGLEKLHACHCTDLVAKIFLARTLPLREVGSGLRLSWNPA